jgi:hypothetical protein
MKRLLLLLTATALTHFWVLAAPLPSLAVEAAEIWGEAAFENSPANNDSASAGAAKIRATRSAVGARASVEHFWGYLDDTDDDNGLHRLGGARCFLATAAPTVLSNTATDHHNDGTGGETDLDNAAFNSAAGIADDLGHGRCWVDTDGADGYTNDQCVANADPDACCTAENVGTCDADDNVLYIYIGVAGDAGTPETGYVGGWVEVVATANAFGTAGTIALDDQLLEGSFNYVYNGSFDIADGTGDATATVVPAGWAAVTSPTYTYTDPSTDTRWGDGFEVVVTNAGTTNEGIQYALTNLPSDTVFKVIARAKDDGTAVCTLNVTGEGGAAFSSTATTTDVWETLSGTFGTTVGAVDSVAITLVTTGADTQDCTWDHVGVYQVGDEDTDRDEVAQHGVVAVYSTDTNVVVIPGTWGDNATLAANFTPPSDGWVVQVGYHQAIFWVDVDHSDAVQCRLELAGVKVAGTVASVGAGQGNTGTTPKHGSVSVTAVNINPTAGAELAYTVACQDVLGSAGTWNGKDASDDDNGESNLWLVAYPPQ